MHIFENVEYTVSDSLNFLNNILNSYLDESIIFFIYVEKT